jgi:hypothetical protein
MLQIYANYIVNCVFIRINNTVSQILVPTFCRKQYNADQNSGFNFYYFLECSYMDFVK